MSRRTAERTSADDGSGESDDEIRQLTRNDSVTANSPDILSMLSYVTVGADDNTGEVDIETFKEECWRTIRAAHMSGGLSEMANELSAEDENRIIVGVRTRPINDRETRLGTRGCIEHLSDKKNIIVRKYNWKDEPYDMSFAFDFAFSEESTQDEVFKDMGWKALKNAFSGFNVSIFAYGQTGSGKSHSMIGTEQDPGLVRRIGEFLFDFVARGEEELGFTYKTTVSAAEIYCENVRDLLAFISPGSAMDGKKKAKPSSSLTARMGSLISSGANKIERMKMELSGPGMSEQPSDSSQGSQYLKIREGKDGVYVEGQSRVEIHSMAEMAGIIFAAIENRVVRATNMNADSSRSHLIFQIEFSQSQTSSKTGRQTNTKSKINLIDLAGSERARTTGVSGDGLREGANINKSLSTLGRVIAALADGGPKDHVPYRDSKLTYILKDSLGGDSKTAMLSTISPAEVNYEETVSTLRYAASVKRIKTSASQHLEQEAGEMIEKLRAEVDALATELKNQEIQAAALVEEHRRALDELEKAKPTKVVKDDKEISKLKVELAGMSKRAERYRTERDAHKQSLDAMEQRADRYRNERKASEERVKALEKDVQRLEKQASSPPASSMFSASLTPKVFSSSLGGIYEEEKSSHAASNSEVLRLLRRIEELEGLITGNAGIGNDMKDAMKSRRETGTHLNRMSQELEATAMEKSKLEQKLRKKNEQLKDPLAVMTMGFSSMFGAALGVKSEDSDEEKANATLEEMAEEFASDDELGSVSAERAGGNPVPRIGLTKRAIAQRKSTELALADTSSGPSAVIVESLRHQLQESNSINSALEQKVNDQHAKLMSLSKAMAELNAVQKALDTKVTSSDSANAEVVLMRAKFDAEVSLLRHAKDEAAALAAVEGTLRAKLEQRVALADEVELALRSGKDELLMAKDRLEDKLRAAEAKAADDLRAAEDRIEAAELNAAKTEKLRAKLEKDLEKLQKRHSELRAASKRLLSEKVAAKGGADDEGDGEGDGEKTEKPAIAAAAAAIIAAAATSSAAVGSSAPLKDKPRGGASPPRARSPRLAAAPVADVGRTRTSLHPGSVDLAAPLKAAPSARTVSPTRPRSPRPTAVVVTREQALPVPAAPASTSVAPASISAAPLAPLAPPIQPIVVPPVPGTEAFFAGEDTSPLSLTPRSISRGGRGGGGTPRAAKPAQRPGRGDGQRRSADGDLIEDENDLDLNPNEVSTDEKAMTPALSGKPVSYPTASVAPAKTAAVVETGSTALEPPKDSDINADDEARRKEERATRLREARLKAEALKNQKLSRAARSSQDAEQVAE